MAIPNRVRILNGKPRQLHLDAFGPIDDSEIGNLAISLPRVLALRHTYAASACAIERMAAIRVQSFSARLRQATKTWLPLKRGWATCGFTI